MFLQGPSPTLELASLTKRNHEHRSGDSLDNVTGKLDPIELARISRTGCADDKHVVLTTDDLRHDPVQCILMGLKLRLAAQAEPFQRSGRLSKVAARPGDRFLRRIEGMQVQNDNAGLHVSSQSPTKAYIGFPGLADGGTDQHATDRDRTFAREQDRDAGYLKESTCHIVQRCER